MSLDPTQSSARQSREHESSAPPPAQVVNPTPASDPIVDAFPTLHGPRTLQSQVKTDTSIFKAVIADLPEGGFGWGLIRALSSGLSYRRMSERNRLAFRIPLPGAPDDAG